MGRKKPTARDDENPQQAAGAKSKKKALVIEDDEYSIGTELSEESRAQEEKVTVTGKKGKKGNSKASKRRDDDDFDDVGKGDEGEDEVPQVAFTGKKKGKSKKSGGNSAFSSSSFGLLGDEDGDDDENSGLTGDDDEGAPVVSFSGKKKASKSSKKTGGSLFSGSAFDAIGDEGDSDGEVVDSSVDKSKEDYDSENEDEPVISFTGKKKPSKGGKKGGNVFAAASFDALDDADEDKHEKNDEDDEVPQITFSGKKKKSSKVSKKSGANSLSSALLDEGNDQDTSVSEPTRVGDDTVDDEDASVIAFTGKKKSSKKKGNGVFTALSEDTDVFEPEQPNTETSKSEADDSKTKMSKEVLETSKSKKKKKKSGRTAQEEDDLDNILAELGEGPTTSKPAEAAVRVEKVEVQPDLVAPVDASGEKEGEEETGESAAAKKKRKKKEKEKEKKAAAAAAAGTATAPVVTKDDKQEETQIEPTDPKKKEVKGKVADKKLPKHVREMQEALARRQELEERLKREAEEKQRKEEEELRKQEELEREKEAARILRKEREKEKLQRKKQEGKFLTPKQKEEQRRREAMRNQILANAGGLPLPTADNEKKAKRPMYQKKKTKAAPIHANGAASVKPVENLEEGGQLDTIPEPESGEFEKVEDVESVDLEEKSEVAESVKDNGVEEEEEEEEEDDDDDPWDVKSFDDVSLSVKRGFSDEEIDSQPVAKKDIKSAGAKPSVSAQKTVPSQPIKSQDGENKKKQPDNDVDKSKKKDVSVKKAAATSNADPKESGDNLRSPICCIMGHVDTGKTKLLDCIRGTNVQEGEAGGITQQIGATYFPAENIRERTKELKADAKLKVPGLLVIDTPGHESFTNLRSRGSGLCDIAILVVDIMHGLEPQTIESLNLLKMRNTEFIVALNKVRFMVDRLYGWKTCRNAPIVKAMKQQSKDVQNEFNMRLVQIITQFKEQGLNTELYYKNKEMGETYSIIPTSAISGEGIPDLLLLLCTVLEVKVIEGLGTTIDVVLVNGVLHEGDQIVVCGMQGPIVATIRSLLTPHPMKELRVKGAYLHHSEIKAAQGIKISAQGLEHAIAGTALHVVGPHDDLDEIKETAMEDMKSVLNRIDKSGEGVCVQASTLGSLEALLEFLKTPVVNIPVSGISIGPVHKKDVMKASVMLEKKKEFATILAFDVKVTPEAREMADDLGVKIFIADIIYHLFDQFKAYIENIKEEKKKESADEAVFPCVLKIMPNCVFNKKDPIILGIGLNGLQCQLAQFFYSCSASIVLQCQDCLVKVLIIFIVCSVQVGTPICIPQRDFISIGRIASIENNHKPVDTAKKGSKLAIKIIGSNSEEQQKMFGSLLPDNVNHRYEL
ncbi:eukaryotic translation initiation factor 5B-like [Pyrus ussuriensis x Pyrus communis]|uniref:Eukaryotic translation initiation factor 5B n=1 Tax=Pyrus ussuriensis x Pyrus communis TaxID=2448454 RepID=A0A5N5FK92_9ROSA|nr:eukaryotic translation initiation factor 5B-like [Pyrus ussuriensis x Pyrus communis]